MSKLYLSGCVFYQLLKEVAYASTPARQRKDGKKDQHNDQHIMSDLVYTFTGYNVSCPKSDVSRYRAGKIEGSSNLPFDDQPTIVSYDSLVRTRYSDAVTRMVKFTNRHLNPSKKEWLIRALLDIVVNDDDILETDMFYVKSDGSPVSKRDMKTMSVFVYQSFLVGILHYILTKRAGKNNLGVSTLDGITDKIPGQERKCNGNLGKRLTVKVQDKDEVTEEPEMERELMEVETMRNSRNQDTWDQDTESIGFDETDAREPHFSQRRQSVNGNVMGDFILADKFSKINYVHTLNM